jgi:hypothetical protein
MSYKRVNDRVLIDISVREFSELMIALGFFIGQDGSGVNWEMVRLANSINEGNPQFIPYAIPKEKA